MIKIKKKTRELCKANSRVSRTEKLFNPVKEFHILDIEPVLVDENLIKSPKNVFLGINIFGWVFPYCKRREHVKLAVKFKSKPTLAKFLVRNNLVVSVSGQEVWVKRVGMTYGKGTNNSIGRHLGLFWKNDSQVGIENEVKTIVERKTVGQAFNHSAGDLSDFRHRCHFPSINSSMCSEIQKQVYYTTK